MMEELLKDVERTGLEANINKPREISILEKIQLIKVHACVLADDVVLVAKSSQDIERNINVEADIIKEYNQILNKRETKVMVISSKEENINIWLEEEILKQVNEFQYLGIIINRKDKHEEETRNRIKTATSSWIRKKYQRKQN